MKIGNPRKSRLYQGLCQGFVSSVMPAEIGFCFLTLMCLREELFGALGGKTLYPCNVSELILFSQCLTQSSATAQTWAQVLTQLTLHLFCYLPSFLHNLKIVTTPEVCLCAVPGRPNIPMCLYVCSCMGVDFTLVLGWYP